MKRHVAIIACLVFLTASAGCTGMLGLDLGLGGGEVAKSENTQYNWNTSADATLTLDSDTYRSVYKLDKRKISVYKRSLGQDRPVELGAVKYRYPNETVITPDEKKSFSIDKSQKRTTIHVPSSDGRVAFVAEKSSKSITTPVFLDSGGNNGPSYEVILPPNTGASVPLLSNIRPNNHETKSIDGQIHITWGSVGADTISARYYLQRDLLIFGGITGLLTVGGAIGAVYYLVQIRKLKQLRKRVGFDMQEK